MGEGGGGKAEERRCFVESALIWLELKELKEEEEVGQFVKEVRLSGGEGVGLVGGDGGAPEEGAGLVGGGGEEGVGLACAPEEERGAGLAGTEGALREGQMGSESPGLLHGGLAEP